MSRFIEANTTEIAQRIKADFVAVQDYLREADESDTRPERLLATSSAMRPALIAPMTEAVALLDDTFLPSDYLPSYSAVCRAIAQFGSHRLEIDPTLLSGVREMAEWRQQFDALREGLETWWQSEQLTNVIYAHTTRVWHHWLKVDQMVGQPIHKVLEAGPHATSLIEQFNRQWSDERKIDQRCRATDKELRGRASDSRPIDGRALKAIRGKIRQLCDQFQAIKTKIEATPEAENDFVREEVMRCREGVLAAIEPARVELNDAKVRSGAAGSMGAAVRVATESLDAVHRMFTQTRSTASTIEPLSLVGPVRQLLTDELALVPGVSPPGPNDPDDVDEALDRCTIAELNKILHAIDSPLTQQDAFEAQTDAKRYDAAARLLERIATEPEDAAPVDRLRQRLEEQTAADRLRLKDLATKTQREVDRAVCYDLVDETTRLALSANVTHIEQRTSSDLNLAALFDQFTAIGEELASLRDARLAEVNQRFEELKARNGDPRREDLQRIESILRQGDFSTADEYISLVRNGQELDISTPGGEDSFKTYNDEVQPAIEAYLREHRDEQLQNWLKQLKQEGEEVFGHTFQSEPHRAQAYDLLEQWRRLLRIKGAEEKRSQHVAAYFTKVGFSNVHVDHLSHGPGWSLDQMSSDPVANRQVCVIPQFGSAARGRYQVLSLEGNLNNTDIVRLLSDAAMQKYINDVPLILLYGGTISSVHRRDLAKRTWGQHRFLLVDQLLTICLATREDGHLRAFFQCTLPFTASQPYSTTASFVPIEMFFGRTEEYKAIVSGDPTHLVFGGRQLGKSVLLREAERREHNPAGGRVVRWIDLKNRGIGTQRPPGELWDEIGQCLHGEGVLRNAATREDTIRTAVRTWLDADPTRTILLLLDEADEFLNQDSQLIEKGRQVAFPVVSQIKGLMDDTERRFKVVFAGLHNVQRAAKDRNTPIGHLGKSVNIGPLIDRGEWKQARQLIELPMHQMGFVFESPDLVTRILSHTNFYPSLIQIFCRHLLALLHDRDRRRVDFRDGPPHEVTMADIDHVYQSDELQAEIRDRFELTLNLDDRYRLIALLIALHTIEMREDGQPLRGLSLREIYQTAMSTWSEGFAQDRSYDGFGILLDEMVGLGVLRSDRDGTYSLRSANVLNLMGSKDRIEMGLYDVSEASPPSEYVASTFRRSLADDPIRRSPLTSQQEGRLLTLTNAVTMLTGGPLAMLGDLSEAFGSLNKSDVHVFADESPSTVDELMGWIEQARRGHEGLSIFLVGYDQPWDQSWLQSVQQRLSRKGAATKNFVRVIFVADPAKRWNTPISANLLSRIEQIQLHPWTQSILDRWLDDNNFMRDEERVGRLLESSGGWGLWIQQLATTCGEQKHRWIEILEEHHESWRCRRSSGTCCDCPPSHKDSWSTGSTSAVMVRWKSRSFMNWPAIPSLSDCSTGRPNCPTFMPAGRVFGKPTPWSLAAS